MALTLKPRIEQPSAAPSSPSDPSAGEATQPTSPKPGRNVRPGWKPTLVRRATLHRLRDIQKSTSDFTLDLSYLTDACVQMALEQGAEAIVRRALADLSRQVNS